MNEKLNQYRAKAESVVEATKQLERFFHDPQMRDYAVQDLERAALDYDNQGTTYRNFMFSELESTTADHESVVQGTLVTVFHDIEVANALIAAGQALGETGQVPDPEILRQTLEKLEETREYIRQTLSNIENSSASENTHSREIFKNNSEEALNTFVDESANVATSIFEKLSEKKDQLNIGELLTQLAPSVVNQLSEVGRFIKQGIQSIKEAFKSLLKLLGAANLDQLMGDLKGQAQELWNNFQKSSSLLKTSIAWTFGVDDVRARRDEKLSQENLNEQSLIEGTNELKELKSNFIQDMKYVGGALVLITFAWSLLLNFCPDPNLLLILISLYLLLLLIVIFRGIDYTDSNSRVRIGPVRGVGVIVDTLI